MGLLDNYTDPYSDPTTAGLLGLAAGMGQASAPSRMPVSFGQALASGLQGMQQARGTAIQQGMSKMQMDMLKAQMAARMSAAKTLSSNQNNQNQQGLLPQGGTPQDMASQVGMPQNIPQGLIPQAGAPQGLIPQTSQGGAQPGLPPAADPQKLLQVGTMLLQAGDPSGKDYIDLAYKYDPGLQMMNSLGSKGMIPNGQGGVSPIPGYQEDLANQQKLNAMATLGPDVLKSMASQSGRPEVLKPGEIGFTGASKLPPYVQQALFNAINSGQPMPPGLAGALGGSPSSPGSGTNGTGFPTQSIYGPGGGLQNPLTVEGEKLQSEVLPEQLKGLMTNYQNAQNVQGHLDLMDHAIENLNQSGITSTGSGANLKIGALKSLNSMASSMGLQPITNPSKIASWEDLNKETTRMGFDLAKTLGSREAQMIVQQATSAVPGAENTYLGSKLVSSSLRSAAQRQQDQYEFTINYANQHGGNTLGADVAFNKANPVSKYVKQSLVNAVPVGARQMLLQHPETAAQFDQMFGNGTAKLILNQ